MLPARIGPYPIEREVGRGGMGVVYLGRDPRLNRPVAIKVLPDAFAADPGRLARFEREARLLASLSHPNIAGIYGLEDDAGRRFLALEYVEGETLSERLHRGPLPLEETVEVARQIASAFEAAHEAGIVHRDLKPGNVKLTPAGDVKVLDFGLAKGGAAGASSATDLSQVHTLTAGETASGMILGTAAYMSPEQARGKPVDRRTDIWSFGCLLFECLVGAQAFAGETVSDTIARILQGEPDLALLPAATPERLRTLLGRCLEKDVRRRLRDIGEARIELEELQESRGSRVAAAAVSASGAASAVSVTPAPGRGRRRAVAAGLVVAGALAGALAWNALTPRPPGPPALRFSIQAPAGAELSHEPANYAISPDGGSLALVAAAANGDEALWVRPLDSFEARQLPGTRGATLPFWSPDGRQIAFFADGKLKRVPVDGGPPQVVCDAPAGRGGAWNRSGVIVLGAAASGPLYEVRAGGGTPVAVTALDSAAGETAHRWPSFLPDGEHFVYVALPAKGGQFSSFVGSLRPADRQPLTSSTTAPFYAEPGHLLFARNEALLGQRFDVRRRALVGDPVSIGPPPAGTGYTAHPSASASANGVLAWVHAGNPNMRLAWIDRNGRELEVVGVPLAPWRGLILSPDDRRAIAEQRSGTGEEGLWILDLERGVATRLTFGRGQNRIGAWSPDGSEIAFGTTRKGPRDIYRVAADGSGSAQPLHESSVLFKDASSWSPDGKWVLVQELGDENGWNLTLVPSAGGPSRPYLATPFNEHSGQISPDGRWVVYASDESGADQAYVQSFPTPGRKQQVSKSGAVFAVWSRDQRELFVVRRDFSVASIPVVPGAELRFGAPSELYKLPISTLGWWPAADGRRFLVTTPAEQVVPSVSIATRWLPERAPGR